MNPATAHPAASIPRSPMAPPRIVEAQNDTILDESGRRVIDLFSGNGAALLGHANPRIADPIRRQLGRVWITGGLDTEIHDRAKAAIESFLPASHGVARLYSTGMEAAEFALRVARVATGRPAAVGFAGGMHGKSMAAAALGWDAPGGPRLPDLHRLPYPAAGAEASVLARLRTLLAGGGVSAVFLEPILASAGGHAASAGFVAELVALCRAHGALSVFDEILTGFHRGGPAFLSLEMRSLPDILLAGKALGNGFPVSAVLCRRDIPIRPEMLPGSTFSGNPLAAAAVCATLDEMTRCGVEGMVRVVESVVREELGDPPPGVVLRGRGALWIIETPPAIDPRAAAARAYARGAFVSYTGRLLRVMPAATIEPANLRRGCAALVAALREVCGG